MKRAWVLVGLSLSYGCGKDAEPSTSASPPAASASQGAAAANAPPVDAGAPPPPASPAVAASAASSGATSAAPAPDAIIAQHVLVIYKGAKRAPKGITRSKAEAKARAREALEKVRGGAPFEDVVKQYSDDAGSVDRMGSVGKFHRDDMDPAFSGAAFALKPGQISDVVETPFGFHVIKRTQ
jgi:hypothetical protein